jgi:hypothetical protein
MSSKIKLQFIPSNQINRIKWDEELLKMPNSLPYAATWYLDAVTGDQWDALISSDYNYLMPLPSKKKLGNRYLPTPLFVQQLGIFSNNECDENTCNQFINQIKANYKLIEFNFNHFNKIQESSNYSLRERCNMILNLPSDRLLAAKQFSDNIKRNIQKSVGNQLRFGTTSIRSIINLFQENKEGSIENWKTENYNILERLYHMSSLRGYGKAYGMYNMNGKLLCGAFFMEWKNRAIFLFSGNSEEGKQTGAMAALIDGYIRECPPEIEILDFEGSDNQGLKRFYQSFGAIEANYVHLKLNRLPFFLRWLKK